MQYGRKIIGLLLSVSLLALPIVLFVQRQQISDWWSLRSYEPPSRIAQLASETAMSAEGTKLFYVNDPQLLDKTNFRNSCSDTERTIVLGCYRSGTGIFLLDVKDERLDGIIEVTAVHEMLHVAYERLSDREQERIDSLTAAVYAQLGNQRITETIEQYEQKGAAVVADELHSILATEVPILSPELETYYAKYLKDRKLVVGFAERYANEFASREKQLETYQAQLDSLKQQIGNSENVLRAQATEITTERARIDRLLSQENFEAYNAAVPAFNASVRSYNNQLAAYKSLLEQYNTIVSQYNELASEERELVEAIDSRLDTQAIE